MKRKVIFLAILVLLFFFAILLVKYVIGRTPKQGVLKVQSVPQASVFLDNKHIGRTPYEDKVEEGQYTIKIVPDESIQSLAAWQANIRISPNTLTYVNRDLSDSELTSAGDVLWLEKISSKQSEISVTTIPDGSSLLLDTGGKSVTPILLQNITPGDHTLTVSSPGFLTRTLKIRTTGGYKLIATLQLALSATGPSEATSSSQVVSPTPTLSQGKQASGSGSVKDPLRPYIVVKETPTGYLRVRMEPTTSATEAARVKPGDKFSILSSKTGWYQITFEEGKKGWVSGQYAEKVE
ncbi:PEGA domain-containing protein [Candidatus Gottesmanbacteria bacterium]|nr:PEGA domain-containing protein [Candidatus Gottesmanbacteria bacterium]